MIAVIGDLMLDIFILSELRAAEQGEGIVLRGGGSAANTAAWITHLDGEATFIGCVGDDPRGNMLIAELEQTGVRCRVRKVAGMETGAVAVDVTSEGERIMRSARGANQALSPDDILVGIPDLTWVHLSGYALFGRHGLSLLDAAAKLARRHRATFSFDPSSPGLIRAIGANVLLDRLREAATVLFPNAEEASELTGVTDALATAQVLSQRFPLVVLKDGERGSAHARDGVAVRLSTAPRTPVDTTGAGDAFDGAAILALDRGDSEDDACRMGMAAGGEVILRYGGRP